VLLGGRCLLLLMLVLPALRLLYAEQGRDRHDDGEQAAQEHCPPAERGADRVVQARRDEEAEVEAGVKVAGSHLAPVLRPSLGDVGAGHRPLAADADAREEAEDRQHPDVGCECGRAGEHRVDQHRSGDSLGAAEFVGDGPPDEREAPAYQEQAEHEGTGISDVCGGRFDA
jgi:hypothetical protein